jgi:hypothetical protein
VPNILAKQIRVEPAQADQLRALFTSPGYSVLLEVIAGHCARHQADWMNSQLYNTDAAEAREITSKIAAVRYNAARDVLDALQANEEEWFRTQLEQR